MATKKHTLESLRIEAGLSQEQLGRLIAKPGSNNVTYQSRISAYETGRKRVPLPVAIQLVKVLNEHLRKVKSPIIAKTEHLVHESHA